MKIIIITTPEIRQGETEIINALFQEGMHRLHLRKPKATASQLEEYINQIHPAYRNRIVLHDHHDLVRKMHLGGIHLNSRNPLPPAWLAEESQAHPITISRSCHSIAEASEQLPHSDYIFLSPIFDSISKQGYQSAYTTEELQQAATQGILSEKTYAFRRHLPQQSPHPTPPRLPRRRHPRRPLVTPHPNHHPPFPGLPRRKQEITPSLPHPFPFITTKEIINIPPTSSTVLD